MIAVSYGIVLIFGYVRLVGRKMPFGEAGEGVISTAVAVLIVAFLGVALFGILDQVMRDAGKATDDQIKDIGAPPAPN